MGHYVDITGHYGYIPETSLSDFPGNVLVGGSEPPQVPVSLGERKDEIAQFHMAELDDATREERRKKSGEFLKMADKLFKVADYEGATRLVLLAMEADPHNPYALAYQERIQYALEQQNAHKKKDSGNISARTSPDPPRIASQPPRSEPANTAVEGTGIGKQHQRKEPQPPLSDEKEPPRAQSSPQDRAEIEEEIQKKLEEATRRLEEEHRRKLQEVEHQTKQEIERRHLVEEELRRALQEAERQRVILEEENKAAELNRRQLMEEELRNAEGEIHLKLEEAKRKLAEERAHFEEEKQLLKEAEQQQRMEAAEREKREEAERKRADEVIKQRISEEARRELEQERRRLEQETAEKLEAERRRLEEEMELALQEEFRRLGGLRERQAAEARLKAEEEKKLHAQLAKQLEEERRRLAEEQQEQLEAERRRIQQRAEEKAREERQRLEEEEREKALAREKDAEEQERRQKEELERIQGQHEEHTREYEEAVRHAIEEGRRLAQTKKIRSYLDTGKELLDQGLFEDALKEVTKVFLVNPAHDEARSLEQAIHDARKAYLKRKEGAKIWYKDNLPKIENLQKRILQRMAQDKEEEERRSIREAKIAACLRRVDGLFRQRAYEKARTEIETIYAMDPGNAKAQDYEMDILNAQNRRDDARRVFEQRSLRGETWRKEEENRERIASMERAELREQTHTLYRALLRHAWVEGPPANEDASLIQSVRRALGIVETDHQVMERSAKLEAYAEALRSAWENGYLPHDNVSAYETLRLKYGVSVEQHTAIEERFLKELKLNPR